MDAGSRWEYQSWYPHYFEIAVGLDELLDEFGQENWELVSVTDISKNRQVLFVFKRPKPVADPE